MMLKEPLVYFTDSIGREAERLPLADIRELQDQMNCNNCDENGEAYFGDQDDEFGQLTILEEIDYWNSVNNYMIDESHHGY
jgi:hypothetical protein